MDALLSNTKGAYYLQHRQWKLQPLDGIGISACCWWWGLCLCRVAASIIHVLPCLESPYQLEHEASPIWHFTI